MRQDRSIRRAITAIAAIATHAWVPLQYPHAIYDEDSGQWSSDAEIAETTHTAFASRRKAERVTVRLIVRRVKDKNVPERQGKLFTAWRYHAFITDSPVELVQAERHHREHAIIEQINADVKESALAHMPSGSFAANTAWLTLRRSLTTSPAVRVLWPACFTPKRAPPPSAAT